MAEVLTLNVTCFNQALPMNGGVSRCVDCPPKARLMWLPLADHRHRRLLRVRNTRPCRRAGQYTDMKSRLLIAAPKAQDKHCWIDTSTPVFGGVDRNVAVGHERQVGVSGWRSLLAPIADIGSTAALPGH